MKNKEEIELKRAPPFSKHRGGFEWVLGGVRL
jgi:hypothetical protein